jgi:hypothetical protein
MWLSQKIKVSLIAHFVSFLFTAAFPFNCNRYHWTVIWLAPRPLDRWTEKTDNKGCIHIRIKFTNFLVLVQNWIVFCRNLVQFF